MPFTQRSKRRIRLLIVIGLALGFAVGIAYLARQKAKETRRIESREAGMLAYEEGDWLLAMEKLGFVVTQDRDDTEALLAVAEARRRTPEEGGTHLNTAMQFFVAAAGSAKAAGDDAALVAALEGQAEMAIAMSQFTRVETTCFEILAIAPENRFALSGLRALAATRGNYLPEGVSNVVRGDRSNAEWLSILRSLEDNSVLRWSLELEAAALDTEFVTRSLILASLRVGDSEEVQRRASGGVTELPADLAKRWVEEEASDGMRILLAVEQMQDEDPESAMETLELVDEASLDDAAMIYTVIEMRSQLPQTEANTVAIARLAEQGRRLAIDDPVVGVLIAVREWQAGKEQIAKELLEIIFQSEGLRESPMAMAEAVMLSLALGIKIPDYARVILVDESEAKTRNDNDRESVQTVLRMLRVAESREGTSVSSALEQIVIDRSRSRDWPVLKCVLGDLLLNAGQNSIARREWRTVLGAGGMVPVRIRLIRSLRLDGKVSEAFREAAALSRLTRDTRSIAELCESWIALEQAGLEAAIVEPGFDMWESPLQLVERLYDSAADVNPIAVRVLPMLVDAAVLADRADIAETAVGTALERKIGWFGLRRVSQAVERGGLDRVDAIVQYAEQLSNESGETTQRALVLAPLFRANGRHQEAEEMLLQEIGIVESQELRDSLGLEFLLNAISKGDDLGSVAERVLDGSFGVLVLDALLDAALVVSDRGVARRAVEGIAALSQVSDVAGSAVLGVARAKFAIAFEREDPDSIRIAILELDELSRRTYLDPQARFLMTQLLEASEASPSQRIEELRELATSQPGFFLAHVRLVEALQENGQLVESRVILDDLVRRFDAADLRIQARIALSLDRQGALDEAATCHCKVFDQAQSAESALRCLIALRRSGQDEKASVVLDRIAKLDLQDFRVTLQVAARMIEEGESRKGFRLIEESKDFPSPLEKKLAIARMQWSYGLRAELAETLRSEAILFEENADAKLLEALLILTDAEAPDVPRARFLLQSAVRLEGSSPGVLGRACLMAIEFEPLRPEIPALLEGLKSLRPWQARLIDLRYKLLVSGRMTDPTQQDITDALGLVDDNKQAPVGWSLALELLRARYVNLLRRGDLSAAISIAPEIRSAAAASRDWIGPDGDVSTQSIAALSSIGEFEDAWALVVSESNSLADFNRAGQLIRLTAGIEAGRYEEVEKMLDEVLDGSTRDEQLREFAALARIRQGEVTEAWNAFSSSSDDQRPEGWTIPFLQMLLTSGPDEAIEGVNAAMSEESARADRLAAISVLVRTLYENPDPRLSELAISLADGEDAWSEADQWNLKMLRHEIDGAASDLDMHLAMVAFLRDFGAERLSGLANRIEGEFGSKDLEIVMQNLAVTALNNSVSYAARAISEGSLTPEQRAEVLNECAESLRVLQRMLPDVPEIIDTKAEFELAVGETERAIVSAQRAVAAQPFRPHFRITLARALIDSGRLADARRQLVFAIHLAKRQGASGGSNLARAEEILQQM